MLCKIQNPSNFRGMLLPPKNPKLLLLTVCKTNSLQLVRSLSYRCVDFWLGD